MMGVRVASLAVLGMIFIATTASAPEGRTNAGVIPVVGIAGVTPDDAVSNRVSLANNPLRSASATIRFGLVKADRVEIKIYDVSGRVVRNLVNRRFEPGEHEVAWDRLDSSGRSVSRGLYFTQVSFDSQGFAATKKLMMIK